MRRAVEAVLAGVCLLLAAPPVGANAQGRPTVPGAARVRFTPCPATPATASQTNMRPRALTATDRGHDLPTPAGRLRTDHVADLVLPDGYLDAGSGFAAATGIDLGPGVQVSPRPVTAPVVLSVLDSPTWGPRVAFLEIRLRPGRPVRWDEDTRLLIGTDGGDGGFVAGPAWQHPDVNTVEDYLAASSTGADEAGEPLCLLRREADGTLDGVLFATGVGDGGYPTVLGRDATGQVVSVVSYGLIVPWALSGLPGTPPVQVLDEARERAAHAVPSTPPSTPPSTTPGKATGKAPGTTLATPGRRIVGPSLSLPLIGLLLLLVALLLSLHAAILRRRAGHERRPEQGRCGYVRRSGDQ